MMGVGIKIEPFFEGGRSSNITREKNEQTALELFFFTQDTHDDQ